MRKQTITAHDVFWLARYTHNALQPLIVQAREVDPSIRFHVEMSFDEGATHGQKFNNISVSSHWASHGMFLYEICLTTKEEVDRMADRMKKNIETLKVAA